MQRKLAVILAADVVGYSAHMEADEAGTYARLSADRRDLFEPEIGRRHGRVFKLVGDGLLAEFGSVVDAVECAVVLQRGMAARNDGSPDARRIEVRIGINLGEVIVDGDDRYGEGVNVAARLEQLASPGGICVSAKVAKEVEKKLAYAFEPMGEQLVKNIAEPIACYRVGLQPAKPMGSSPPKAARPPDRPAIAILPFLNMSGDPEQEYFSDGITEDIITDLSKISGLRVLSRNTVFAYKNRPAKAQQTAQELGVRYVLEGSVRKAGSRIRVTGQLVDGRDGGPVWAERYDRDLTDIFAIQDELTGAIVDQLKIKLLPAEQKALKAAATDSVDAYTYYLRGRQFSQMFSKSYLLLARRMFVKATELDPAYARAYAGIADCDSMLHLSRHPEVSAAGILAMSEQALALDPGLAEAHASRAMALHFSGRKSEAIAEFEHAMALQPDLYEASYFYARFFFAEGDFVQAARLFERATELRSDDYHSPVLLCGVYRALGRDEDRRRSARTGIERAERELNLRPENAGAAQLGAVALAHLGDVDRARDWAARALALDSEDVLLMYNVACVYAQLGEVERSLDLVEKVLPHASPEQVSWFMNDADLDPIRGHPRYRELIGGIEPHRTIAS